MKKIIFLFVLCTISTINTSFAQDSAKLTKGYVGIKSTVFHENKKTLTKSDFYVAIEGQTKTLGLVFTGRLIYSSEMERGGFAHFFASKNFSSHLAFNIGFLSQPISTLRPHPVSVGAHFEPEAVKKIPGAALGGTISGIYNSFAYVAGIHVKNEITNYGGAFAVKVSDGNTISLAGYYSKLTTGFAFNIVTPYFLSAGYYEKNELATFFLTLPTSISPYIDLIYNHRTEKTQNLEIGVTKEWSVGIPFQPNLLMGIGYKSKPTKTWNGYLLLSFQL